MKKNIFNIGLLAMVGFAGMVTSCSNDFDFDEARRENPEFAYKQNFEKAFGKIDPDQSWDFTTYSEVLNTRAGDGQYAVKSNDYVQITSDILGWLKSELPEGAAANFQKGHSFLMTVPEGGFRIIPAYQGYAYRDFEIHLVIENAYPDRTGDAKDYDVIIWCRNDIINSRNGSVPADFRYTTDASVNVNNMTTRNAPNVNDGSLAPSGTSSVGDVKSVFSKPIDFVASDGISSPFPASWIGKTMYFYLYRIGPNSHSRYDTSENKKSRTSLTSNFLYLEPKDGSNNPIIPSFLGSTNGVLNEYRVVGCEMEKYGDKDLNDAVFVIEGFPKVPEEHTIGEDGYEENKNTIKRYMVEDLGATDESDIDFNDIVIDLVNTWKVKHTWDYVVVDGKKIPKPDTEKTSAPYAIHYSATVRALGGTKNIAVFLGNGTTSAFAPGENDFCIFSKDPTFPISTDIDVTWNTAYTTGDLDVSFGADATVMYNTNRGTTESGDGKYITTGESGVIATIDLDQITEAAYQWNPSKHNIYVKVYENSYNSKPTNPFDVSANTTITFPTPGEVPAMIAVDMNQAWNWERINVFGNKTAAQGQMLKLVDGTALNLATNPKK